jgi:hypothetical protein
VLHAGADWLGTFSDGMGPAVPAHFIEGHKPAFFQGLIYFLVGPVCITKEIKDVLLGHSSHSSVSR